MPVIVSTTVEVAECLSVRFGFGRKVDLFKAERPTALPASDCSGRRSGPFWSQELLQQPCRASLTAVVGLEDPIHAGKAGIEAEQVTRMDEERLTHVVPLVDGAPLSSQHFQLFAEGRKLCRSVLRTDRQSAGSG